ncbi:MAG: hypothetical protein ABI904_05655 [Chloroflexota bacterium]
MECPNCKHATSNTALLQCSHCGEAFERGPLEEYQHLEYLADWLSDRSEISPSQINTLLTVVEKKQDALLEKLLPKTAPEKPQPVEVKPIPAPVAKAEPVADIKPAPAVLKADIKQAVPVAIPTPASKPKPVIAPKPAAPPKPKKPPVDWRKVITDAATSGALLRALLYLGAFMIVVSAAVLVIRFWNQFNPILQLVFIASIPLTFYAGGWLVRTRLKLAQAGTVLTGIGAILVAVDFAAIYQLGAMGKVNGPAYWLVVTILCTALYAFTARRTKGEFFDYLTLLAGGSVLFTFTRLLHLPMDWSVASVTAAGTLMAVAAVRHAKAKESWKEILHAARYLSQILIPVSVAYVILLPIKPLTGHLLAFLSATIGYAVLAIGFPALVFAYAALAASIGTIVYGLHVTELSIEWYATVTSVLALMYIFIGQRTQRIKSESPILKNYVTALNITGLLLIALGAFGGFFTSFDKVWAGVIAMTIAALDLTICAYIFGNSFYTLSASSLFILPFAIAFGKWFNNIKIIHPMSWLTVAIGGLALTYILIGAGLKKTQVHARWLFTMGHILAGAALFVLPLDYLINPAKWQFTPALISLGVGIAVYLLSFLLQHSGGHSSLNAVSTWLPFGLGKSLFLWPIGFLFPVWVAVAWRGNDLSSLWLGAILALLGLAYIGAGQGLFKYAKEYRLPFHTYVYALCTLGILISIPSYSSTSIADRYPLLTTLLITVASTIGLAYLYNRVVETIIASLLFVWFFQLSLEIFKTPIYAQSLAYVLLASLVYTPIAVYLKWSEKSRAKFHYTPVFIVGYALTAYAVIVSIVLRDTKTFTPWIGVVVPLIATALFTFSASYFKAAKYSSAWAWAGTLTFTIAFSQSLTLFKVPAAYDALAWVGIAAFYILFERILFFTAQKESRDVQKFWSSMFHQPWIVFAFALTSLGLALSLPDTFSAFAGTQLKDYLPVILAQAAVALLAIASARLYQNRWLLFIEPFIAFLPATLFFIGYGKQIFGQPLTTPQYALIWTALGAIHAIAGTLLDRAKVRYSHGLYLGGYIFLSWAVAWSLIDRTTLTWTFGFWILAAVASALLVHFNRHQTWEDFVQVLFGKSIGSIRTATRNLFQWLAAWTFPIWCATLLFELNAQEYAWLGLVVPPLAYLGLVLWFRRIDSTYAAPLFSSAQFFTVIGLLISVPTTLDFFGGAYNSIDNRFLLAVILLQAVAVLFYSASAWVSRSRRYTHIAAWLSILPFTIAWRIYGFKFTYLEFVIPWLLWATVLIAIGFALDKSKVRYSHGPYFAGYVLSGYALAVSTTHRITNIYALAITITLALISYITVHYGRHHTYEDFIFKFWYKADETTQKIASTFFLFFAAYTIPVLLTQILAYVEYPLAWRGVWLAILAPLYVAIGLFVSKSKSKGIAMVPTWALYSAGYALTAIGAMVAFENETVATYVLILNAVVYGVSAYIFQQSLWLYLSTVLTPIIALLILHQTDRFESTWVAWIFIAFAYIYLAIGQLFDRTRKTETSDIHPFAAPFYAPGFLLSAIALAVASSDRALAIQIYSAGVILYALSAWIFREALFIYPAAWLAAVPYYLLITLTSLDVRWYGLAWLPLIVAYIAIGRIFFHKEKLAPIGQGMLVQWLTHPAIPFYLLAYALSISMLSLSYTAPLPLTIAFGVAALLYFVSAYLFKKPAWIYPALFAIHMTVLAYFTINPSGGPARYITIPFLAMTWITSLVGYAFERKTELTDENKTYRFSFLNRLFGHAWARPFFAFAIIEMVIWQSLALTGTDTTIIVATGYAILFALFSLLWMEGALVYGAVGFSLLVAGAALKQAHVQFADAVAVFGGIGFGLYLLGRILDAASARVKSLSVWLVPLTQASITLTALAVAINLSQVTTHWTATAATLAFAGALYVTIAYRGKMYRLGYLGMALLELAWVIVLFMNDVSQPQLYAIPGGLYFMGIAYLELHRERKGYAIGIEILGLGVLLVTTFIQSLNGVQGLPYFVLLLVEALLVVWWGTLQKRKVPFFAGIGFSALNILAQLIVLVSVYDINRWFVAFGAGLFIMGLAIYIERSREQLRVRVRELGETLEAWE